MVHMANRNLRKITFDLRFEKLITDMITDTDPLTD